MTIRRNVDLSYMSSRLTNAQAAVDTTPSGTFARVPMILDFIGEKLDEFIREAREQGINVCNSDGAREIEALVFEMIRSNASNDAREIALAIKLGELLTDFPDHTNTMLKLIDNFGLDGVEMISRDYLIQNRMLS